jgi:hypothetical protein
MHGGEESFAFECKKKKKKKKKKRKIQSVFFFFFESESNALGHIAKQRKVSARVKILHIGNRCENRSIRNVQSRHSITNTFENKETHHTIKSIFFSKKKKNKKEKRKKQIHSYDRSGFTRSHTLEKCF